MKKLDLTEPQRLSFQDRLPERVSKRDTRGVLQHKFYSEFYYGSLDFGVVLRDADKSDVIHRYAEVLDNVNSDRIPLLLFSRPHNPIYVIYPARLYWVDNVRPAIYLCSSIVGSVCIATLTNFLEGVPIDFE